MVRPIRGCESRLSGYTASSTPTSSTAEHAESAEPPRRQKFGSYRRTFPNPTIRNQACGKRATLPFTLLSASLRLDGEVRDAPDPVCLSAPFHISLMFF